MNRDAGARKRPSWLFVLALLAWCTAPTHAEGEDCPSGAEEESARLELDGELLDLSLDKLGFDPPEDAEKRRPGVLSRLRRNLRMTLDLSSRVGVLSDDGSFFFQQFAGFDIHKVLPDDSGDWGTAVLQGYLTRHDDVKMAPPFFEGEDDWEFVFRIFNFNWRVPSQGRLNVRVGHFEIPFGLEQEINTNGTLRDFNHGRTIGVKADWGVSLNGRLSPVDYEVSLTRGTGNEWSDAGNPFIFAGRTGVRIEETLRVGLSGFHGRVLSPGAVARWGMGESTFARVAGRTGLIERTRGALDLVHEWRCFTFLAEVSAGQDFDQEVFTVHLETDWNSPTEAWWVYVQGRLHGQRFDAGWDEVVAATLGVRFAPDNHWAFSAQIDQTLEAFSRGSRDGVLRFQIRYRF